MERITCGYQRLFEVRVLHHYWLDEGATTFDLIASPDKRERRLLNYDLGRFLKVTPTASTAASIAGFGGVFKATPLGFIVAVSSAAVIPADTTLDFAISAVEGAFFNYTALTLRPRAITEIFYQPEQRLYRYKENVPLLSNLTGAARTLAGAKALFLSQEFPALAADDLIESLVSSGPALQLLTSDQPGAATMQIAADASTLPIFVNQGDVPVIVPPAGMSGTPARGILLDQEIPDDVLALVRLTAVRPTDQDFSFVDNAGHPKTPFPVFQVRFRNRSTTWSYLDKGTGAQISQSPNPLPLTFFGNAGTGKKPSEGVVKPVFTGTRITELISEIYI